MSTYTAITFSPVQGFIEKSRKLRDLAGASLILSYLTHSLVVKIQEAAKIQQDPELRIISPGWPNFQRGMPNRILLKGDFSHKDAHKTLINAWKKILRECRIWIENNLQQQQFYWKKNWNYWGSHSWETFWGQGDSPKSAMDNLEQNKLKRNWTGVNWIGESSSLTGADAIAYPEMNQPTRNPQRGESQIEKQQIANFYEELSRILENLPPADDEESTPTGTFLDASERLSIPELVKRLVTWHQIRGNLGFSFLRSFSDIVRFSENRQQYPHGQWTGWFMGDGDKVGDYLKELSEQENRDYEIRRFSVAMRRWGQNFQRDFPRDLGRVIYAGGDDFLGVIYNRNFTGETPDSISGKRVLDWLERILPSQWRKHEQNITLSLGFVWVGSGVPQRDILQHCREAEQRAKNLDRDRLTIRVVFNSGQFIQWTCPWYVLAWFRDYQDREGIRYAQGTYTQYQNRKGQEHQQAPNWSHIYNDLAQLEARHAFDLSLQSDILDEYIPLRLFDLYFPDKADYLSLHRENIVGNDSSLELMRWIKGMIQVGWQLCA